MIELMLILGIAITIIGWFVAWAVARRGHLPRDSGLPIGKHNVSLLLLIVHAGVHSLHFVTRQSTALFEEGLSTQNVVQVLATLATAAWCAHLLLSRRVQGQLLFGGPSAWLGAIVVWALVSSLWSVSPTMTAYRGLELGAIWVLAVHVGSGGSLPSLRKYLLAVTALVVAGTLIASPSRGLGELVGVGSLRSNHGSFVAAASILLVLGVGTHRRGMRRLGLLGLLVALLAFGSVATLAALTVGLIVLAVTSAGRPLFLKLSLVSLSLPLIVIVMLAGVGTRNFDDDLSRIAPLLGKDPQHFETLTGRVPLWGEMARLVSERPLGYGYAAGERMLGLNLADRGRVGWQAENAHSGYASGWLGGGWIGLVLTSLAVLALAIHAAGLDPLIRSVALSMCALLAVNNLTLVAIGGRAGAGWVVGSMLASLGTRLPDPGEMEDMSLPAKTLPIPLVEMRGEMLFQKGPREPSMDRSRDN